MVLVFFPLPRLPLPTPSPILARAYCASEEADYWLYLLFFVVILAGLITYFWHSRPRFFQITLLHMGVDIQCHLCSGGLPRRPCTHAGNTPLCYKRGTSIRPDEEQAVAGVPVYRVARQRQL